MPITLDGTNGITLTGNLTASGQITGSKISMANSINVANFNTIDFTDIPNWTKRITVLFNQVSANGTNNLLVQLGSQSGFLSTGYDGFSVAVGNTSTGGTATTGFVMRSAVAAASISGSMTIFLFSGNTYVSSHTVDRGDGTATVTGAGRVDLGNTLTQVRVTLSGTNIFDAGSMNIMYE